MEACNDNQPTLEPMILQHANIRRYCTKKEQAPLETNQTKETFLLCADSDDYFDKEFDTNISPGLQLPNEPPQLAETLQPGERHSRDGHVLRPSLGTAIND